MQYNFKKVRTEGFLVNVTDNTTLEQQMSILNVLLYLAGYLALYTVEFWESGKMTQIALMPTTDLQKSWMKRFDKICEDNDKCNYVEKEYSSKEQDIEILVKKLGIKEAYKRYRGSIVPNGSGNRLDVENAKKAKEMLGLLWPVMNEKGHLLLAEDRCGNSAWAYVTRKNADGSFSYRIYKRSADERVSDSVGITPYEVSGMGTKVAKTLQNYEASFTAYDATQAAERLWLWNLCRNFDYQDDWDDLNPSDINDELYAWVSENVGVKISNGEKSREPIFVSRVKNKVCVGIWCDDMEPVFKLLGVKTKVSDWIREAKKEGWLEPTVWTNHKDGTEKVRTQYNPSVAARAAWNRENKNERIYLLNFEQEEAERLLDKYSEMKSKKVESDIKTFEEDM